MYRHYSIKRIINIKGCANSEGALIRGSALIKKSRKMDVMKMFFNNYLFSNRDGPIPIEILFLIFTFLNQNVFLARVSRPITLENSLVAPMYFHSENQQKEDF